MSDEAYEKKKATEAARSREKSKAGQDIYPIPECLNPERRAAALKSTEAFAETYFPQIFYLPWARDQRQVMRRLDEAEEFGGLFSMAMMRGGGKSALARTSALRAILGGRHPYVFLIGATADKARGELRSIKGSLLSNDTLYEDFPEVCHPIRALEGRANRARGQHCAGQHTFISWGATEIVLPYVPGSRSSEVVLKCSGMDAGSLRGANYTRMHDGQNVRPSYVVIDDPQTPKSAKSVLQCEQRHSIIMADVLGLAGPGKKISCVVPCTIIRKGDLADRLLDRQQSPEFTGQKYGILDRLPERMDLWETYFTMRRDEIRNGGDGHLATVWYGQDRVEMDKGAIPAWPEMFYPDELGAIQHAMNWLCLNPAAFWAEKMNDPMPENEAEGQLDKEKVAARAINIDRGTVPIQTAKLIAAVDVQQNVLYWGVGAFWQGLGGHLVSYGTWPDQKRRYFKLTEVQNTIARAMHTEGVEPGKLEGQLKFALTKVADLLLDANWPVQEGGVKRIDKMIVDAGFETDTVKTWCLNTRHAATVIPWHGKAVKAKQMPWSEYPVRTGETRGFHWLHTFGQSKVKIVKHLLADSYFWKSLMCRRLQMSTGDPAAFTLFNPKPMDHKMFAEHVCAEYFQEVESEGRRVNEWEMRVQHEDNHFWDIIVMLMAGASFSGLAIEESQSKPKPRPVVSYKDQLEAANRARDAEERKKREGGK